MKKYKFSPPGTQNAALERRLDALDTVASEHDRRLDALLEEARRKLEERLEHGVQVLTAATGGPDAERLLAHWNTLMAEYDGVLAQLEAPGVSKR